MQGFGHFDIIKVKGVFGLLKGQETHQRYDFSRATERIACEDRGLIIDIRLVICTIKLFFYKKAMNYEGQGRFFKSQKTPQSVAQKNIQPIFYMG